MVQSISVRAGISYNDYQKIKNQFVAFIENEKTFDGF